MIRLACIPNCPNCKYLKMMLEKEKIQFESRTYDPDNPDDVADMCMEDIYNAQFPVVWIDGVRQPAMTVAEYMQRIRG